MTAAGTGAAKRSASRAAGRMVPRSARTARSMSATAAAMGHDGRRPRPGRSSGSTSPPARSSGFIDSCDGTPLSAPNDLMFDCDGNMWFTDLGKMRGHGKSWWPLLRAPRRQRDHAHRRAPISYNGVGLSPDMNTVYVADTLRRAYMPSTGEIEEQEGAMSPPGRAR